MIDIGGIRLYADARGAGAPTVVFEAALGASSLSWTFVQPAVAAFARAWAYDRAGFGRSEGGVMPRTAGRIADELRTLLERAAEHPPFLLVGHSFGGLVVRIFASRYPELTAGVVLVDPAHPEDWVRPTPKDQARLDRGVDLCRRGGLAARLGVARLVSRLVDLGAHRPARALVGAVSRGVQRESDWILAPMFKLPREVRDQVRSTWTRPAFFDALGSQIRHMPESSAETLEANRDGFGDLPLVTISSTAPPGEHRLRQQDALAALSTRGRHIMAANSGHWIPLDEPSLVVATIRDMHATLHPGR